MPCFPCIRRKKDKNRIEGKIEKQNDRDVLIEEEPYIGNVTIISTAVGCFFIGPFSLFFLLFPCDRRIKKVHHLN